MVLTRGGIVEPCEQRKIDARDAVLDLIAQSGVEIFGAFHPAQFDGRFQALRIGIGADRQTRACELQTTRQGRGRGAAQWGRAHEGH